MGIDVNAIDQTVVVTAVGDEVNVNVIDQPVLVSVTDQIIEVEASGGTGPQGPAGAGVAAGGTTGQVLSKASSTNYDTVWVDAGAGTVYSVNASGSTGISVTGGPITGAGTLTITNTAPDQVVSLSGTGGTVITGTYPNFTIYSDEASGYVPYTGALQNVDLGEYELKAGQLTLDVSPTGTAAVGTTRWNNTIGSSETTLKGGNVVLKNGVDLVARVVNKVSPNTTLTKAEYQAVRISGAQGQRLAIELAQGNNDNNSADTIGLVTETIAPNQEGFIITVGQLEGINTTGSVQGETWVDGDVLYLSPTTAGKITNVKPVAPQHLVIIGYVEYAHANNGKIYVKTTNGFELGELHDVNTSGATNGQVLKYNGTIWTPSSDVGITSLNGLNPTSQTFATGTSGTDFAISSASSTHTFNLPTASATNRGALSSSDWSTFNSKQNALTNPVTGTGTINYLSKFTDSSAIGNSQIFDNGTAIGINTTTPESGFKLDVNGNIQAKNEINIKGRTSDGIGTLYFDSNVGTFSYLNIVPSSNEFRFNIVPSAGFYKLMIANAEQLNISSSGVTISTISNASSDTDKFLVSDGGIVKYRTGTQLLSDIGGQAAGSYVLTTRQLTINGTAYDLSADRSWSVGTVTSLTLATGTTGTDVNVSNGTITSSGTITLNIPDASATARGLVTTGTQTIAGAKTFSDEVTSTNFVLSGGTGNTGLYFGHTDKVVLANYVVGGGIDFETNGGTINMVLDASANLSVVGNITGASIIKSGGTSSQFLKADGSVDSSTYYLASNPNAYIALTALSASSPLSYNNLTGAFTIAQSSGSQNGYLSSTDWNTFNNKQGTITLTTTGSSGASTFISNTLNIPTYTLTGLGGVPTTRTLTINGTAYDLSADRTWTIPTHDAVTIGTANGLSLSGQALSLALSSGSTTGALSSTDWTTFNNKQNALTNPVTGTGTTNYLPKWTSGSALGNSLVYDDGTNLGVGTSVPASKLAVLGDITLQLSGAAIRDVANQAILSVQNTNEIWLGGGGAGYITKFYADGSEQMRLTSTGLGIGTTSPVLKLDVISTSQWDGIRVYNTNAAQGADVRVGNDANNNLGFLRVGGSTSGGNNQNTLMVGTGGGYDIHIAPNGTPAITVKNGGLVGIGTTSPSHPLSVAGVIQSTNTSAYLLRDGDVAGYGIYKGSSTRIGFAANGNEVLTVTSTGNLGLGVVPSAWGAGKAIQVDSAAVSLWGVGNQTALLNNSYYNSGDKYATTGAASYYLQASGEHKWFNAPSGTAGNAISFTQAMTLSASGNLLIGTTTDGGWKLQVNGNSNINGTVIGTDQTFGGAYRTFAFGVNSNSYNRIFATTDATDGIYLNAATGQGINFRVNGGGSNVFSMSSTGAATFSSDVKVNLGTDAIDIGTATGNSYRSNLILRGTNASGVSSISYFGINVFSTDGSVDLVSDNNLIFRTGGSSERLRITSGGNLLVGTTTDTGDRINSAGSIRVPSATFFRYDGDTGLIGSGSSISGGTVSQLGIRAASDILFATNGANERMRITSGGSLGLGTTAPDVFGRGYSGTIYGISSGGQSAIELNSATGNGVYFDMGVNGSRTLGIYSDTTNSEIATIGSRDLLLSTNATPRITIKSGGVINIANVPSSATGLSSGDIYKDASGFLKIV